MTVLLIKIDQILFGDDDYIQTSTLLKYYGFAILPLTMIMVAEYYLIAKSKILFAYLFGIALPIQLIAIHFHHETMVSVIYIMGATGMAIATIGFLILSRQHYLGRL